MKFTDIQRRSLSLAVLTAFVFMLCLWSAPAAAATAPGKSTTAVSNGDGRGTGFLEKESATKPVVKKAKKFPWLFVGIGAVAVGVTVLLLLIVKPRYELKVRMGVGVSGTPDATSKYKKGTVVSYEYRTLTGYMALVTLDGLEVPALGTLTMDRDHSLAVSAEPSYTLTVIKSSRASGTPAVTTQYKRGAVVNYSYTTSVGYGLEVTLDGVPVPVSGTITMDRDKTLVVDSDLLDIRGTWQLTMVYLTPGFSIYNYSSTWVFSGTMASGTFIETAGPVTNTGTYSVANYENAWFKYTDKADTFVGKMTGKKMSGTFTAGSAYNGTWSGNKP